jgi:hypothetical protein
MEGVETNDEASAEPQKQLSSKNMASTEQQQ